MIDTHCHILPGVDDGAADLSEAMMMAAMAADDGIRAVIATPHLLWDGRPVRDRLARIESAARSLRAEMKAARIPLVCYTGAEVLCADTKAYPPKLGEFPCLAGTDYALIEFYFDEPIERMEEHLHAIRAGGIRPIIAHPERYSALQKDKDILAEWVEDGCLLQINKGSPLGQFGRRAKKVADWLLRSQLAALLATDAHDRVSRTPRLSSACAKLSAQYGEAYLKQLTANNPGKILFEERLRQDGMQLHEMRK